MNLQQPYGDGNHRRIGWRRTWDVNREVLTATHTPTGFVMAFVAHPSGGYTARVLCELPAFGPDERDANAQMNGLLQLQRDAWEIFHIVMRPRD
ncbi:MAG: hypothetical protein V4451_04635 [Pseudomonadota bacterium]